MCRSTTESMCANMCQRSLLHYIAMESPASPNIKKNTFHMKSKSLKTLFNLVK